MIRSLVFLLTCTSFTLAAVGSPTPAPKTERNSGKRQTQKQNSSGEALAQSANGWMYVKGEWVHPEGYKFVKGQVLRTTAQRGKPVPQPPGKLAQENAEKLTAKAAPAADTRTAEEKAAETKRKNLIPRPAPQTGTHL